jgi:hypothetical protein
LHAWLAVQQAVVKVERCLREPLTPKAQARLVECRLWSSALWRTKPGKLDWPTGLARRNALCERSLLFSSLKLPDSKCKRHTRETQGCHAAQSRLSAYHGWCATNWGSNVSKIFIAVAFLGILASLGSAFFYLMRDKGRSNKTVKALAFRVGLSILLFLSLLVAHQLGLIESTGVRY